MQFVLGIVFGLENQKDNVSYGPLTTHGNTMDELASNARVKTYTIPEHPFDVVFKLVDTHLSDLPDWMYYMALEAIKESYEEETTINLEDVS